MILPCLLQHRVACAIIVALIHFCLACTAFLKSNYYITKVNFSQEQLFYINLVQLFFNFFFNIFLDIQKHFLTISYLFSIPISDLKFHCPFEVLHLEILEKIFFQVGKKNCSSWKNIFLVGKIIFSIFPHEKTEKLKKYYVTIIVLTFYCLYNLF